MRLLFLSIVMVAVSCTEAPKPTKEVRPWRGSTHTTFSRRVSRGQDCFRANCETGHCVHFGTHPDRDYICTDVCSSQSQCREGLQCRTIPGAEMGYCIPPMGQ